MDYSLYKYALSVRDQGGYQGALELFQDLESQAQNPDELVECLASEAVCLTWLHRFEEGKQIIKRAECLHASGDLAIVQLKLSKASLLARAGEDENALTILRNTLEQHKEFLSSPELNFLEQALLQQMVALLLADNRFEEARAILIRGIATAVEAEDKGKQMFYLAVCQHHEGEPQAGFKTLEIALSMLNRRSDIVEARYFLGQFLYNLGEYDRAAAEFRFCIQENKGELSIERLKYMLRASVESKHLKPM